MTHFDDLILEQCIRRRVGEPGTISRNERGAGPPLGPFRDLAERISGRRVDIVTVTDGIPGHFSPQARDHQTVVFHERQLEVCAFLHGLTFEKRLDERMMEDSLRAPCCA